MPLYPFIFVLPNGDVLYAGGEEAAPAAHRGRILVPGVTAADWKWADVAIDSTTNGGSAVMYEPGKIMKSGGLDSNDEAVNVTETIDLSCYASDDYPQNLAWEVTPPMKERRHFHTLTLLPNGHVIATGGNTRSNGVAGESYTNPCEINGQLIKEMPCSEDSDCPTQACIEATNTCDPLNNACFATKSAEIWEPVCSTWTEFGEQQRPRMYHSTAALLPDGRVMSTGGGHRTAVEEQPYTEYFEPKYGDGTIPEVELVDDDIANPDDQAIYLPYEGSIEMLASNFEASGIEEVNLVKLAAVTHQFDQGQLYVPLEVQGGPLLYTVEGPKSNSIHLAEAIAPPGYYMLFAQTDTGEVSTGQYVRVGGQVAGLWECSPSQVLTVKETVCNGTPVNGSCPAHLVVEEQVPLPSLDGGGLGWEIVAPAGLVEDPNQPTSPELAALEARCVTACEQEWASFPEVSVNCAAGGAFAAPSLVQQDVAGVIGLIPPDKQDGSEIFAGQSLNCSLGESCCQEFDESLCKATHNRPTLAAGPQHGPVEHEYALSGSTLEIETSNGTTSLPLSGQAGYGFCKADDGLACPFHVDHIDASYFDPTGVGVQISLTCDDSSSDIVTLSQVDFALAQPTFGINAAGSESIGFTEGGLLFDVSLAADGLPFALRRPNTQVVIGSASDTAFAAQVDFDVTVPCNNSHATLTARLNLNSGTAIASPPDVTLPTPVAACNSPMELRASVNDPDNDVVTTRWRMDGVLLAPQVTEVTPTGLHVLEVTVTDARGAATSEEVNFTCY